MTSSLSSFQKVINYKFTDQSLLVTALTHKSYALERGNEYCNERLEFLGDSVLSACAAIHLYERYPCEQEGKLSKLKGRLVSAQSLFGWAGRVNLASYVLLGKNEKRSGARQKEAIICDAFEAIIGAIFLDGGFESAQRFVLSFLGLQGGLENIDYKSDLQEMLQKKYKVLPVYKLLKEYGPDHEKKFEYGVYLKNKLLGTGAGYSKKEAQVAAAEEAINNINQN